MTVLQETVVSPNMHHYEFYMGVVNPISKAPPRKNTGSCSGKHLRELCSQQHIKISGSSYQGGLGIFPFVDATRTSNGIENNLVPPGTRAVPTVA